MIQLHAPYQTRPIRFLELVHHNGWQLKTYGIRYQGAGTAIYPDEQLITLAKKAVLQELPETAVTKQHYGVGFFIIHQGQQSNWLLLDWWFEQEILKQKLFSSPLYAPHHITPAEPDLLACTWELNIHAFERQAWVETVLNNPNGPDLTAYLERQFNRDV